MTPRRITHFSAGHRPIYRVIIYGGEVLAVESTTDRQHIEDQDLRINTLISRACQAGLMWVGRGN